MSKKIPIGRICDLDPGESLQKSKRCLRCLNEQRTEIAREYFQHIKVQTIEIQCPRITNKFHFPIGRKVFYVADPPTEEIKDDSFFNKSKNMGGGRQPEADRSGLPRSDAAPPSNSKEQPHV